MRRAIAALLVEAARIDGEYDAREHRFIERFLAGRFSLAAREARSLRMAGEEAQAGAADVQRFTRLVKTMSVPDRLALMEELWMVVLSDGRKDPFEDMLMRRLCGLIHVDDRMSAQARQRAEAFLAG